MMDLQGPPVWNIEGTALGEKFEEHLKRTSNEQRGPSAGLVCVLCGFPKEKHRPESLAHHSECTLEQFQPGQARGKDVRVHAGLTWRRRRAGDPL